MSESTAIRPTVAEMAPSSNVRIPYVCGAMTGMHPHQDTVRIMFQNTAAACYSAFGHRGWMPHEHLQELDSNSACEMVREQMHHRTSIMLLLGIGSSCGAGVALEMADRYCVPVILFRQNGGGVVSPQVLGHPAVRATIILPYFLCLPDHLPELLLQAVRRNSIILKGEPLTAEHTLA